MRGCIGAAELVEMRLDDISWENQILKVRRPKTGVPIELPLLPAVAKAIVSYMRVAVSIRYTWVKGPQFAWPVSLAMGPAGDVYFTCYQVPDLIYKNPKEIKAMGPYSVYRFKTETLGPVGH